MRRSGDTPDTSAWFVAKITLFRVPSSPSGPPFTVLVGGMFCFLILSRRLELVVARSAAISAWQFTAPAMILAMLIGAFMTAVYNPVSAILRERSTRLESDLFGYESGFRGTTAGFWLRLRNEEGQAVLNAKSSHQQGIQLSGVTVFRFDPAGSFLDRIEAKSATLERGDWRLDGARFYVSGIAPTERDVFRIKTTLTPAQVGESFATPETVPFWGLASYIDAAENAGLAASGYRLQYYQLLAQPFYLLAMVLLAASVSLRFFRMGGVQKIVLGGISGYLGGWVDQFIQRLIELLQSVPTIPVWLALSAALPRSWSPLLYQEDG
jgi:lipopolysaccharide export system permease protein